MADACIVCLGDLRTSLPQEPPTATFSAASSATPESDASGVEDGRKNARKSVKSVEANEEAIAHLLPCKHDLHNACLTPWVERANSCPICRATFNMVELSEVVGGPVISSYAVQDKLQEAELDPSMIVEDELFAVEAWEPCIVCGAADDTHEIMYCDGCDKAVHVFCAGHDESPDIWYCEKCMVDLENDVGLPGMASAVRGRRRRRPTTQQAGSRRNNDALWARVWQEVSRRLDLDLDFPFDEEIGVQRTDEQRREFARWQRRFEVASQQGAANRLRNIANARIRQIEPVPAANPESQEEIRAWNAFDKARESHDAPLNVRRNKRKRTASPESSAPEIEASGATQQKRPRLWRARGNAVEPTQAVDSSNAPSQRPAEEPTFLSSLLREVETKPVSAGSPGASEQQNGQFSPYNSSPAPSPPSSDAGTPPRRLSATPPPMRRPISPPLSSTIVPLSSPIDATFSPFSPRDIPIIYPHRGRPSHRHDDSPQASDENDQQPHARASSDSPSRGLSYSAKGEIQRMVKLALGPRYRDKAISKDQYTEINRVVSRKLYELVGSAEALAEKEERERWQGVAEDEVRKAVESLSADGTEDAE